MNHRPLLALLSLLALSCGGGEAEVVDGYIDNADRYARSVCECEYDNLALVLIGKAPYGSKDECLADLPANSAERGCVEGLFSDEMNDYSAVLDCRARAYGRTATCLNGLTCTDTMRADCYKTLDDEYKACADLPDDVEKQLDDCLYN